jgi:hypothetical protein
LDWGSRFLVEGLFFFFSLSLPPKKFEQEPTKTSSNPVEATATPRRANKANQRVPLQYLISYPANHTKQSIFGEAPKKSLSKETRARLKAKREPFGVLHYHFTIIHCFALLPPTCCSMSSESVFVLPGDHIDPSLIPSHPKKPVRLGPGLRHVPPSDLLPTLAGQLVTDRLKNAIRVETANGRVS